MLQAPQFISWLLPKHSSVYVMLHNCSGLGKHPAPLGQTLHTFLTQAEA